MFYKKQIKVLIISGIYIPDIGGPAIFVHSLSNYLKANNVPNEIIALAEIDKLFVSSKFQKESLVNKYNWPKKKISIINSFRYTKLKKIYNTIFIPFHFDKFQSGIFIEQLNYLSLNTTLLNNKFKVSIHPNKKNQKEHLNLKDKINSIIKKSSKNKSTKNLLLFSAQQEVLSQNACNQTAMLFMCLSQYSIIVQEFFLKI